MTGPRETEAGGKWSSEPGIRFSGYRTTQTWLKEVMAVEGLNEGDRLMTMYGGMDSERREAVKAAFQASPDKSPVRILLDTDPASEGLDLHNFCSRSTHIRNPLEPETDGSAQRRLEPAETLKAKGVSNVPNPFDSISGCDPRSEARSAHRAAPRRPAPPTPRPRRALAGRECPRLLLRQRCPG